MTFLLSLNNKAPKHNKNVDCIIHFTDCSPYLQEDFDCDSVFFIRLPVLHILEK